MAEPKTKKTTASVPAFLKAVEDPQRREDCLAVAEMMRKATKAEPRMWGASIVGFDSYAYGAGKSSAEWPIVGFSPRKGDLTLYIMPGFDGREALLAKLGPHKTGKSCLYLKRLADVDRKVLQRLIDDSVAAMRKKYPK